VEVLLELFSFTAYLCGGWLPFFTVLEHNPPECINTVNQLKMEVQS